MIVIESQQAYLDEQNSKDREIKFVMILDKFYALNLTDMLESKFMRSIERRSMIITQELLDSFPPPRYNIEYVTEQMINDCPVFMLQTPGYDDLYFRHDGRHRILAAHRLGFNVLPAIFIPRSIWGRFIVCLRDRYGVVKPLYWDKPPNLDKDQEAFHEEPNYVFVDEFKAKYNLTTTNAEFDLRSMSSNFLPRYNMSALLP